MHYTADKNDNGEWQKGSIIEGGANNHERRYFDEKGRHLKQDFLTSEKKVRATYLTVWDKKGKTVLADKYLRDGEEIYLGKHSYPRKDYIITNTYMRGSDVATMRFETKIKDGKEVYSKHTAFDEDGDVKRTVLISSEYNQFGESEFKFESDGSGNSYHFKYEYLEFDKHNNWTKALKHDMLKDENIIIERELEYYD